jgi:predicted transport protein
MMTVDEFFNGYEESRQLFEVLNSMINAMGSTELRVTKSQIAFRRRKAFAWIWIPGKYLRGKTSPLVLTLSFSSRDTSPRWKEIVEPYPGHFTHHLELYSINDIDEEVRDWLRIAWIAAA